MACAINHARDLPIASATCPTLFRVSSSSLTDTAFNDITTLSGSITILHYNRLSTRHKIEVFVSRAERTLLKFFHRIHDYVKYLRCILYLPNSYNYRFDNLAFWYLSK